MLSSQIIVKTTRVLRLIHVHKQELKPYAARINGPCLFRSNEPFGNIQVRDLTKEAKNRSHWIPKHAKDRLTKDYELIYGSTNINYILLATPVLAIAFTGLIVSFAFMIFKYHVLGIHPPKINFGRYHFDTAIYLAYIGLYFILKSSFYIVKGCKGIVLRMYYNKNKDVYVGILFRPFMKNRVEFKLSDVKFSKKEPTKFAGNFLIHGKRYTINAPGFIDGQYYKKLSSNEIVKANDQLSMMSLFNKLKVMMETGKRTNESVSLGNRYTNKRREMKKNRNQNRN